MTRNTGLRWEKLTEDGSIHDKYNLYNWMEATSIKVAALNSDSYLGHSDWRLPSKDELLSAIGDDGFAPSYYWSSMTYASYPSHAWYVDFNAGHHHAYNKTNYYYVRAVRGSS